MLRNILSVLFVAVLLISCQPAATPQVIKETVVVEKVVTPTVVSTTPNQKLVIPLGWLYNDEFAGLAVAYEKGYYSQAGLEPTFVSGGGSTGFDPNKAINGFDPSVRIGVPAALSLVLAAKAEGLDVVAIGALTQVEPSGFIYLVKEGESTKQGPCDWKGKTIAMQTDGQWYLDTIGALCPKDKGGPLKSGVDFNWIPAGFTPDCLLSKQCDFYCGWKTNQIFGLQQQGKVLGQNMGMFLTADFLPFYYADPIVTTSTFIKEHPDIVKAFVTASVAGLQYTYDHPDEAAEITSRQTLADVDHARWRIPIQNGLMVSDDTKAHGIGYMDPVKVQAMIDFLYANGQIAKSFKAEEVIDNSFLPGPQ